MREALDRVHQNLRSRDVPLVAPDGGLKVTTNVVKLVFPSRIVVADDPARMRSLESLPIDKLWIVREPSTQNVLGILPISLPDLALVGLTTTGTTASGSKSKKWSYHSKNKRRKHHGNKAMDRLTAERIMAMIATSSSFVELVPLLSLSLRERIFV